MLAAATGDAGHAPHKVERQQGLGQPCDSRTGRHLPGQQRDLLGPHRPAWAGPGQGFPMYLPLSQTCLNEGPPRGERQVWGPVCFLNSAPVSLSLPGAPLPAPVSRASGGGKAPVSVKLMICPCAKPTGGCDPDAADGLVAPLRASPEPSAGPLQPAAAHPHASGPGPQSMPEPLRSLHQPLRS